MTFLPQNTLNAFVNPYLRLTGAYNDDIYSLRDTYYETAEAVNLREIAQYPLKEVLTGARYFDSGDTQKFRYVFRTVLQVADTAAGATGQAAHGITQQTIVTRLYGTATTATEWQPIPYASNAANDNVELYMDSNNVYIVNGSAHDDLSNIVVVIEYLKQDNTG